MQYGYFDDSTHEYVVTRPDTPLPWLNYLGQEEFFGLCTNTAGGYTFWKDARYRRLTRYRYNNIPLDTGGCYLYIRDHDTGQLWNPGWKPLKTPLDHYQCRHGLGYTSINATHRDLQVEQTMFVPPGETLELWRIRVTNHSPTPRRAGIFTYVEFAFYEALNDQTNYQRTLSIGEVGIERMCPAGGAASAPERPAHHNPDTHTPAGPTHGAAGSPATDSPESRITDRRGIAPDGDPSPAGVGAAPAWTAVSSGALSDTPARSLARAAEENPSPLAIYHHTEYRERRNHYTLFACTGPVSGWDTDRDSFVGVHEGLHEARVPLSGTSANSVANGWNPIGSHHLELDLKPGETQEFLVILAYVEQPAGIPKFDPAGTMDSSAGRAILERYLEPGAGEKAFARLGAYWDHIIGSFRTECPDPHLTRIGSVWNQYQCMATFNLSRATSLYETGIGRGMGFRDSNQDILGFVHMIPGRARERILDIAATQLSDGTCYHQYQPLTKKGNADIGGDFYDDHLWLILSTTAYIKETGDLSILDEQCPYADAQEPHAARVPVKNLQGSPTGTSPATSGDTGALGQPTLLDHLELSIAYTMRKRGPHGLPLIGHADWNDCLNLNCFSTEPNESFQTAGDVRDSQAESVMIAGLFLRASTDLASIHRARGCPSDAARVLAYRADMLETLENTAWDGEWYLRAFDAKGQPVGSRDCDEGQIFIESQGWCVLGGAGIGNGRARQALESVHEKLFTPDGVILQQPPYSTYRKELGEITSYPPGVKENAGIFSHNNTWIQLALCAAGEGSRAHEYYLSICPSAKEEKIDIYRSEPYVYAQMTAGRDSPRAGEAKNSWLTGTAAWSFVVASQGILGVIPDFDALVVDPCIPPDWKGFTVMRKFRGSTYEIEVDNPRGLSWGVTRITVDGRELSPSVSDFAAPTAAWSTSPETTIREAVPLPTRLRRSARLPLFPAGETHQVRIELG